MVALDQNPESKRMTSSPVAPARRTRATSSSTKRTAPRWVLAPPLRHPDVEHLPGECPSGQDRVVAELLRVSVAGSVFGFATHLTDGGVDVDDDLLGPRARPERPGPAQGFGEHCVELADVSEGEGPEERAQGGGRHHPMTKHRPGGARAQHVGVIDV